LSLWRLFDLEFADRFRNMALEELNEAVGFRILETVKKYIIRDFSEAYEVKVKSLGLSADEELLAETLCVNKYSRAEWNLRY